MDRSPANDGRAGPPCADKLVGISNWHTWNINLRLALRRQNLQHLLSSIPLPAPAPSTPVAANSDGKDTRSLREDDEDDDEQAAGMKFLLERLSDAAVARVREAGWRPEGATVRSTLRALERIMTAEQEARAGRAALLAELAGLTRTEFAGSADGGGVDAAREYIVEAKRSHDELLMRYDGTMGPEKGKGKGGATAATAAVLDNLFAVSVMEGVKACRPEWHGEWVRDMVDGRKRAEPTRRAVTRWLLDRREQARVAAGAAVSRSSSGSSGSSGSSSSGPKKDENISQSTLKTAASPSSSAAASAAPAQSGSEGGRRKGRKRKYGQEMRCRFCSERHPRSTPHDDESCWFSHSQSAPAWWRVRFLSEGVSGSGKGKGPAAGKRPRMMAATGCDGSCRG